MIRIDRHFDEDGNEVWASEPYDDGTPEVPADPAAKIAALEAKVQELEARLDSVDPPPSP